MSDTTDEIVQRFGGDITVYANDDFVSIHVDTTHHLSHSPVVDGLSYTTIVSLAADQAETLAHRLVNAVKEVRNPVDE
jgi:hypothetical protein